jgi:hypothetical protein
MAAVPRHATLRSDATETVLPDARTAIHPLIRPTIRPSILALRILLRATRLTASSPADPLRQWTVPIVVVDHNTPPPDPD